MHYYLYVVVINLLLPNPSGITTMNLALTSLTSLKYSLSFLQYLPVVELTSKLYHHSRRAETGDKCFVWLLCCSTPVNKWYHWPEQLQVSYSPLWSNSLVLETSVGQD